MRMRFAFCTIWIFVFCEFFQLCSTKASPQVVFRGGTKSEAFHYVMKLIKRLPNLEKRGYSVVLPEHEAFKKLYENHGDVSSVDEGYLEKIFAVEIYDESLFEKPLKIIRKTVATVNRALNRLADLKKNWGFLLMPKYEVVLTLYGPGASYSADIGKIVILARPDGTFKRERVEESIVHEIVHIGIEKNIVKKYKLGHWQKERVVDLICSTYLKDILPEYKIQKKGDKKIDSFVDEEAILRDLPSAIEKFKAQLP